jgi:hypothetical protein
VGVGSLCLFGERRHFEDIDPALLQQLDASAVLYEEAGFPPRYDNTRNASGDDELGTGLGATRSLGAGLQSAVDGCLFQAVIVRRELRKRRFLSMHFRVSLSGIASSDFQAIHVSNDCTD